MSLDNFAGVGTDYEVLDQDFYKRAVMKPAPTCFTVEVLAPAKQGKAHSYGVRIIPVNPRQIQMLREAGDDALSDTTSVQSVGKEYDIWRRWDDCLDFQYKLEAEYERMSREKKRDLRHGKKGSGDTPTGIYRNPTAAASFESLPEGPDPKGIKVDLHAYIPRLTKKSSFFSASDATVQKRAEEFAAMIYGLFKQDCPKLIEQLRDSSTVRDFFAWWRRDQDLLEKAPRRPQSAMSNHKPGPSPSASRASVDSSFVFTTPPSPDSPGFSMLKRQEKVYVHPQRSPTESTMSISSPTSIGSPQIRADKVLPSPPTSPEHHIASPMKRARSPMALRSRGGTPQLQISRPMPHPQYEDRSLLSPPTDGPRARSPARSSPVTQNHIGRMFNMTDSRQARAPNANTEGSSDSSSTPPITPTRGSFGATRERPLSQLSIDSIDSADINLDLSFIKLEPAPPGTKARFTDASGRNKRDSILSISSLSSIRTTDSADGVLGRAVRRQSRVSQRRRRDGPWSPDSRLSVAVPEEDESVFYHSDDSQGEDADPFALEIDSMYDDTMSYMEKLDSFPDVPTGDSDTGVRSYYRDRDWRMSFPASVRESVYDPDFDLYDRSEPSSPTSTIHGVPMSESGHSDYSTSTITTLALEPGMCAVKVKYGDDIVAVRLPLGTPLSTLRARLSEKFMQAQGIQLHYRFGLAYAVPRRFSQALHVPGEDEMPIILSPAALSFSESGTSRPLSTHSGKLDSASPLKRLVPIWSQDDWETALHNCGNKVVLHVFDQEVR